MQLNKIRHIYFLGIGGIGMSALARYFRLRGLNVSGYDRTPTPLTDQLQQEGMHIVFDENPDLLPANIDLVVFTPAVPPTHQGLLALRQRSIPVMKRSEVLGLISNDLRSVCIAGTHGKTTTSTMTSLLLRKGGLDVSAFLGGISLDLGSNYILGSSDLVVLEADEYDRSFLQLRPFIA
ncbi:MAG: Mur ligase domain-containing protein [Saprospiraceae bacterium]|nr:Mur ligase domain-containing protein [Saprospiraceae bacterium]